MRARNTIDNARTKTRMQEFDHERKQIINRHYVKAKSK